MFKIDENKNYTVDTSVVKASCLNYANEMSCQNEENKTNYDEIQRECFSLLMQLHRAKIVLDAHGAILAEYQRIAFDENPHEFAAQWFQLMSAQGKILTVEAPIDNTSYKEMKKNFHLSKTDCQFVHVAAKTTSRTLFHREKGLKNAAGYIKKNFEVKTIHILKQK